VLRNYLSLQSADFVQGFSRAKSVSHHRSFTDRWMCTNS